MDEPVRVAGARGTMQTMQMKKNYAAAVVAPDLLIQHAIFRIVSSLSRLL